MKKRDFQYKIFITVFMSLGWVFWMIFIIIYKLGFCYIVPERIDLLYYIGIGLTILEYLIIRRFYGSKY
jgi:hypothetical protein